MKRLTYLILIILGLTLIFVSGCTRKLDLDVEKAEVQKVLKQFDEAMKLENIESLSRIFAHDADMVILGTDELERWVGWDAFEKAVKQQFDIIDNRDYKVRNNVIQIHQSGLVAWFSKSLDWEIKVKDKVFRADDLRYTGVLEKRDGKWVFVQYHVSVPVEGQLVEY